MSHHDHDDNYHVHAHISSTKQNLIVLFALFALTGMTVGAYRVELGEANLAVAVIIATIKAALVCYYFMHLKYEKTFNTLFFLGSLLFLLVFLGYTANDTEYRAEVDPDWGVRVNRRTGDAAAGTGAAFQEGEFTPIPTTEKGE
jgi:cytochrome c oxidase subunit IV